MVVNKYLPLVVGGVAVLRWAGSIDPIKLLLRIKNWVGFLYFCIYYDFIVTFTPYRDSFPTLKKIFHKISAVSMALVVLFTTMSFTVDMHYCGDTLRDFSISHRDASCGMEKQQDPLSCESVMSEESCCTDAQMVVEGQDDLKHSFHSLSFDQQVFIASFVYSYINLFSLNESEAVPFIDTSPPFLEGDLQVLYQTFLI